MRTRIIVIVAAVMLVIFGALGGLALASYAGTASAKDPGPPAGMPEACQSMDHENMGHEGMEQMHESMHQGMERMHEGMHGTSEDTRQADMEQMPEGMHQGVEGMHEDTIAGDGRMGEPTHPDRYPVE